MTGPLPGAENDAGRPRPHHFMNADGYCHAGDMFEAGTAWIALYAAEALADAWDAGHRSTGYEPEPGENPYRVLPPDGGRS